ncbi:MAG: hypothetical protein WCJ55_18950, partial [Chloroflexales bacterium]
AIFAILMQYLGNIVTQIIGWLGAALPPIITTLGQWALAFIGWVVPMIPPLLAALGGFIGQILTALGAALPGIVAALSGFIAAFVDWVLVAGPPLLRQLGSLVVQMLAWAAQQVPGIANQLGIWALQFLSWVTDVIPKLILALGGLYGEFLTWLFNAAPGILEKLGEWSKAFTDWVTTNALPALLESLGKMWDGLWTELQKLWTNAFAEGSLGKTLVDALITGLTNSWEGVTNFVSGKWNALLQAMPGWAKKLFGIEDMPALPPEPPNGGGGAGGAGGGTAAPPPDAATQAALTAAAAAAASAADASAAKLVTAKANLDAANAARTASPTKANEDAYAVAYGLVRLAEYVAKVDRAAADSAAKAAHRASGGPVKRGGFYLVGEQGPEYFQPGADGAIHPTSVYQAIQQPLANLGALVPTVGATQALPRFPGAAAAGTGAGAGSGGGVHVHVTVNNPVVDSDARLQQFKREITAMITASLNRTLAAEG